MLASIDSQINKILGKLIKIRRALHANPEVSGKEEETMAFIAGILESLDMQVKRNIGGFGLFGTLRGGNSGKTIAIRADMDALPITEKKGSIYRSKREGVMHACGHDIHMTVAIGAAMVLTQLANKLNGNVRFIFQPCEEGVGGAREMMKAGVLKNPDVDAILGLHVLPSLNTGEIGIKRGTMMASADKLEIVINGRSGHAAQPHKTVDAILVASMVINAIHHIVSRQIDPFTPSIISLGMINGGTAPNIIANRVEIRGTVRSLTDEVREQLSKAIEKVVKGVTSSMGASYEYRFTKGSPPLINDDSITNLIEETAKTLVGADNVIQLEHPTLGGEDFSFFLQKVQGAFFRLGTGNEKKDTRHPLHNEMFDADEDSIAVGVRVMANSVFNYLKGKSLKGNFSKGKKDGTD